MSDKSKRKNTAQSQKEPADVMPGKTNSEDKITETKDEFGTNPAQGESHV